MLHSFSPPVQAQAVPVRACRLQARACSWVVGGFAVGELPISLATHRHAPSTPRRSERLPTCSAVPAARSESTVFRHPGELDLNLREYMVVLDKPVGLTLAPDPRTGQVVVQDIKDGSPAQQCGLIQVGDVVKNVSAVFGDDMWGAVDIRRVRWAINSRMGDVRLILERSRRPSGARTAWYCDGKAGVATCERDGMQLPYSFNNATPDDSVSFTELPGAGRNMQLAFHRNTITQPPPSRRTLAAAAAHSAALQRLRRELQEARGMPRLDLSYNSRSGGPDGFVLPSAASSLAPRAGPPAVPSAPRTPPSGGSDSGPSAPVVDVVAPAPSTAASSLGGGGRGSGTVAAAAAGAAAAPSPGAASGPKDRRVVTFMPWLLVACGRLEHRHIAQIASSRSLGALLELSLTRSQPPPQEPADVGTGGGSSGSSDSSSSSGTGSGSSKAAGYLVVRGSDLVPLAGDVGRVSYQALLAAAGIAPGSSAVPPSAPWGEAQMPPPPGSAAATAAMIHGTDVVAPDGSSLAAVGLASPGAMLSGSSSGSGNGTGSSSDGGDGGGGKDNGGGIGSGTMAFLNRSIFLNMRPNSAAAAAAPGKPFGVPPPPGSASSPPVPAFAPPPASRYDPVRVRHLLNAAASLQRLTFRRGGKLHRARRDQCAVLLHCDEGMEGDVAVVLAGWLHWFGRLPLQEASLAAETAIGVTVDQGLLEAGTAALLQGACERSSRVVLTWKYGGLSAYVAGDVVASWSSRVPMVRCRSPLGCRGDTHPGHFFLEVQGMRPGVYYYKYIVDGTWAVDSLSSKVLDSAGNWNNVLVVPEPPQVLTSREGLALARWQAARLALEAKMGLTGPAAAQRQ